ncbi:MAG: serine/threonine-protein kinase [Caldilineaceae bacterium]|nr:serine/threonine-protein kinase [Caldilineaceae bacterium]
MAIPDHLDWKPLNKKIGSGGQGTVHLVYHKDDPAKTPRALKILKIDASQEAYRRFQKEIKAVSKIDHHAIIEVIDHSSKDEELQFLVMKYHWGAETIEEVCLSSDSSLYYGRALVCLYIFEQLISAIQACESQPEPIYHRDISPKNVLVLPDTSIRLIDFGLCQTVGDSTLTLAGEDVGTRNYAPPECSSGNDLRPGTYTDIYSAAKVLWSAITSQYVFDREEAVLNEKSMRKMFPHKKETWHLDHIFRNIIRQDPNDRLTKTSQVFDLIKKVRHAILDDFAPLESVVDQCPACKRNTAEAATHGHPILGGRIDPQFPAYECTACGFAFVRRHETLDNNIKNHYI